MPEGGVGIGSVGDVVKLLDTWEPQTVYRAIEGTQRARRGHAEGTRGRSMTYHGSAWDGSMSRVAYQGTRGRSRTYLCGMPVRHACHTRMPVCHPPETRAFRAFIPPKPRVFWGFIFGGLMCSCRLADSSRLPEFWEFLVDDLSRKRVRMRGFQCSWR